MNTVIYAENDSERRDPHNTLAPRPHSEIPPRVLEALFRSPRRWPICQTWGEDGRLDHVAFVADNTVRAVYVVPLSIIDLWAEAAGIDDPERTHALWRRYASEQRSVRRA